MRVCVVIPYYQRRAGILRRALDSVFAQDCTAILHVVIVDDGSPVSAAHELETLSIPPREVITQVNGGSPALPAIAALRPRAWRPITWLFSTLTRCGLRLISTTHWLHWQLGSIFIFFRPLSAWAIDRCI